jgi:signal transduction histidine kinase
MKNIALFWAVHPLQGLAESLLIGLLILLATAHLEGYVEAFVFQTAMFFLCGACGMWAVLRIRLPQGGWQRQTLWEMVVGMGLSLVMLIGLRSLGMLFNWDAIWRLAHWEDMLNIILLVCTGPGYFLTRGGVRLWLRWDQMRRQRMLWSLTHAHLTVVVFFAFMAGLIAFIAAPYSGTALKIWEKTQDPLASLVTGLLVTFFPVFMLITLFTVLGLAVLLPPLAAFSFFVARRTTRRLEALTQTTAALRAGDYQARVPVDGEDEVARLQSDFNAMAEKLETTLADLKTERDTVAQVLQARRDLVASVSHELRTPVATLRAAVETALTQQEASPETIQPRLEMMENEIQRLSGLIDDLFTLSQAEVNNLRLECAPIELSPIIGQVVQTFAPLAWQAGRVEVTDNLPPTLPLVQADASRLQQVLLNLLRNAVRHTPPGGIVAILASIEGEGVRLEVRDTGEGIDPADLPHIWERFYRGKNATTESAGLGLALVKELVEAMGGRVGVASTPGQGSCFTVWLHSRDK